MVPVYQISVSSVPGFPNDPASVDILCSRE